MNTLEQLHQTVKSQQQTASHIFVNLNLDTLNFKPSPESWSILECLEHLNRYSRYYIPALQKAIISNSTNNLMPTISYSWLGKKSIEMVHPGNKKQYKTVKHMNPNNSQLTHATVNEFIEHQNELLVLLDLAKRTDLAKKVVPVEFFKLLKLKIGETLEFVITHQERHLHQAIRVQQYQTDQVAA